MREAEERPSHLEQITLTAPQVVLTPHAITAPSLLCEEVLPHRHQLLPPAAQMDDASWDKLFTTATLTDYQAEDVVRALPGSGWGRDGACVSVPRLGVL